MSTQSVNDICINLVEILETLIGVNINTKNYLKKANTDAGLMAPGTKLHHL